MMWVTLSLREKIPRLQSPFLWTCTECRCSSFQKLELSQITIQSKPFRQMFVETAKHQRVRRTVYGQDPRHKVQNTRHKTQDTEHKFGTPPLFVSPRKGT